MERIRANVFREAVHSLLAFRKALFFFFFFSQTQKGRANESTHTETRRKEINFPKCKHLKIFIFKRFALLGRFLNNLVHHIIAIHHRVPACSAVLLK